MTTAELERIAREIVPPVGRTGWRATVLEPRVHAVVPIIDGRLDGKPVWRGAQRDLYRLMDLLEGRTPASRRARDIPAERTPRDEPDRALPEAPVADASSGREPVRLCAGCDEPLPADARPNRMTHDATCRQRAQYRRDRAAGVADADSASAVLTLSDRSEAAPSPRVAHDGDRGPSGATADRSGDSSDVGPTSGISLPHARPGAEPLGVGPTRSAAAPGLTAGPRAGQADGDPAGSGRAIASANPGRIHPVATQPPAGVPVPGGAGGDQLALPLAVPSG